MYAVLFHNFIDRKIDMNIKLAVNDGSNYTNIHIWLQYALIYINLSRVDREIDRQIFGKYMLMQRNRQIFGKYMLMQRNRQIFGK